MNDLQSLVNNYGIRDTAGDAVVARQAKLDRDGDQRVLASLSYDLEAKAFQWKRNWRPVEADTPIWESTDWAGVLQVLQRDGGDVSAMTELRKRYQKVAAAIGATGV